MSEVNAAGRVFRVQGSSFQEKTCLGSPKNRTAQKKRLFNAIKKKARARHAIAQGSEQRAARNGRRLLFTKLQATRICAYNTHYVIAKDWLPSALRFGAP